MNSMEDRAHTPAQANVFLKAARGLFTWAVKHKHIKIEPTAGVEWITYKSDGFVPWNWDDVRKFCEQWEIGTMQRLALEIGLVTGLRRSDIHLLNRRNLVGNIVTVYTVKTNTEVTLEFPDRLIEIIAATPSKTDFFVESSLGKPFESAASFGNWFKKAAVKAGIRERNKNMHGVRKLAATTSANSGASSHELMAQFGWANVRQAEYYTKGADRRKLGVKSSRLVAAQIERSIPPTNPKNVGESETND